MKRNKGGDEDKGNSASRTPTGSGRVVGVEEER